MGYFKERFAYDGADRLTRSWWESFGGVVYGASAPDENAVNSVEVMRFDAFGNLCSQRSTGAQWVYGGRAGCGTGGLPGGGNSGTEVGAHQARELRVGAVVIPIQFDANGNQHRALMNGAVVKGWEYDGDDRSTAVWKGTSAAAATRLTRFENGVGGGRVRRIDGGSTYGMPRTTTYLGSVERVERNGVITWRRHIAGIAVQTLAGASPVPNHTRYLLQDLLGSAVAVVDAGGSVVERSHYSVYGARQAGEQFGSGIQTTERGFTGHEQVDDLETVHMGARVYDPTAGRFLQPDPLVQQVYRPQNWNPYAYAWNNPLRFTDPTGMFNVGRALQMLGTVLQIAAIFIPGLAMVMPMISQFLSYANIAIGFAQGGVRGGLAACFGAFVGGGGGGLGGFVSGLAVGGVSSVIAGGRFKQGVLGSLKSQAVGTALQAMGGAYRSRQTGGKQANGAETATQASASGSREVGVSGASRKGTPLSELSVVGEDGVAVTTIEGRGYKTPEAAARAVFLKYERAYFETGPDQELLGGIVKVGNRYYYTRPVLGSTENDFRLRIPAAPAGATYAGTYHTHPAVARGDQLSLSFSDRDMDGVNRTQLPDFLRTPAGTFRALDPNGFLNHGVFGRNLCPGGSATCFSPHPNY